MKESVVDMVNKKSYPVIILTLSVIGVDKLRCLADSAALLIVDCVIFV